MSRAHEAAIPSEPGGSALPGSYARSRQETGSVSREALSASTRAVAIAASKPASAGELLAPEVGVEGPALRTPDADQRRGHALGDVAEVGRERQRRRVRLEAASGGGEGLARRSR